MPLGRRPSASDSSASAIGSRAETIEEMKIEPFNRREWEKDYPKGLAEGYPD